MSKLELEIPDKHPAGFFFRLKQHNSFKDGKLPSFARYLLVNVVKLFDVEQAGIWLLNETKDRLICYLMYNRATGKFVKGQELLLSDYPDYFRFILRQQRVVAHDAGKHPAYAELQDAYIRPNKVSSLLDTAIIEGRKIVGILCLEHKGRPRNWTPVEVAVAGCVCTFFTNVMLQARSNLLSQKNEQLANKNHELNVALQHVMELQSKGQKSIEESFSFNVTQKLVPLLQKLKHKYAGEKVEIDMIEGYLKSLTSPFYRTSHKLLNLSPQEHKIVELIRAGHQAKEIGRLLNLSEKTVQTHKKNIRRKLKLQGKQVNLQNYLDQFELLDR